MVVTAQASSAVFSPCGTWRYQLERRWDGGPPICWVLLNPSTADSTVDDPTVRRVLGFSRAWGYPAAVVVNLFALRATNPDFLKVAADPVGLDNDGWIDREAARAQRVIAAWGAHAVLGDRGRIVADRLRAAGRELWCLGTTKDGYPKHPLYLGKTTTQREWSYDALGETAR